MGVGKWLVSLFQIFHFKTKICCWQTNIAASRASVNMVLAIKKTKSWQEQQTSSASIRAKAKAEAARAQLAFAKQEVDVIRKKAVYLFCKARRLLQL